MLHRIIVICCFSLALSFFFFFTLICIAQSWLSSYVEQFIAEFEDCYCKHVQFIYDVKLEMKKSYKQSNNHYLRLRQQIKCFYQFSTSWTPNIWSTNHGLKRELDSFKSSNLWVSSSCSGICNKAFSSNLETATDLCFFVVLRVLELLIFLDGGDWIFKMIVPNHRWRLPMCLFGS